MKTMTEDVTGSSRDHWILLRRGREIVAGSETEHIRALIAREARFYPRLDYLPFSTKDFTKSINEAWRRNFCDWFYELVDHFGYDREVVSIALDYLDRTVAKGMATSSELLPKRKFQLIAVTCLYIAIKLHGEAACFDAPRKVKIIDYVELSRGFFQVQEIETTERQVLSGLEWRVNPPTCSRFVAYLIRLCPKWSCTDGGCAHADVVSGIFDVANYLTQLSVCVAAFSKSKNSVTAYACIYCAIEALQHDLPLPCDIKVVFLEKIEKATALFPELEEVQCVRKMIKNMCPSMFDGGGIFCQFLAGQATVFHSPKIVVAKEAGINSRVGENGNRRKNHSGHKRNRTCGETGDLLRGSNIKARCVTDA